MFNGFVYMVGARWYSLIITGAILALLARSGRDGWLLPEEGRIDAHLRHQCDRAACLGVATRDGRFTFPGLSCARGIA